jgi:cell division protein YceG involved in septum cleavage
MSKGAIITLVIVIIVVIGGIVYWTMQMGASQITPYGSSATTTTTTGSNPSPAGASAPVGQVFAGSDLAANAYLISSGTFDATTKKALSGFSVQTSTNPDGSMQIVLKAQNPEYHTQVYTVQPGEQLYFIEKILTDDVAADTDKYPNDDSAVLVDPNGYIVQVGSPMPASSTTSTAAPNNAPLPPPAPAPSAPAPIPGY